MEGQDTNNRHTNEENKMNIDNLTTGTKVSLSYAKTEGELPTRYTGYVEKVTDSILTLKILNKGFRSFTRTKIVASCVEPR